MKKDLVSIITPMYNSEKYIRETYESIRDQIYDKWEWIVIDDLSTDCSRKIIKEIERKDSRVKLIKNKEKCYASGSRNVGLKIAKGRYITFIDSDDLWVKEFLLKQLKLIKNKNCGLVYSSYERKNNNLEKKLGLYIVPDKVTYKDLLKSNYLSCLTVVYDTNKIEKTYFNETLRLHEDYALWLKIVKKTKEVYGNSECLAIYRIREGSSSRNKIKNLLQMFSIFYIEEKLGLIKTIYYMFEYSIRGLIKNKEILLQN